MEPPDTRSRILGATMPVFAARGYAGSTTRALADAAGVNVATLAWHFGGKRGLYEAVLDRMYEELLALEIPKDLPQDPEERVRLLVRLVWGFMRERRDNVRLLKRHVLDRDRLPEAVRDKWTAALLARAQELTAALGIRGDIRMALLDMNHLIARYAISDADDLVLFVEGDPIDAIGAHLEERAVQLLLADAPGPV